MDNLDRIAAANFAALKNTGKDPFSGHDTVPGQIVYGAFVVTFLANLGNFHLCRIPQLQLGTYGYFWPVNAQRGDVLCKIPKVT